MLQSRAQQASHGDEAPPDALCPERRPAERYQVVGQGPIDLVFVPGFLSNLDVHWEDPEDPGYAHLLHRLSGFTRLIQFDKRGTGLSDRVDPAHLPDLETRMDDVRAVMDAAGSGRAALLGASEDAPMSLLFAATHPERVRALVLYGGYACFHRWVQDAEAVEQFVAQADTSWGSGENTASLCSRPSRGPGVQGMVGPVRAAFLQSQRRDRAGAHELGH